VEVYWRQNIRLLYIFRGLRCFLIIMPVIIPFFQEKGLCQTQIYLLESMLAVGILFFEIPSGYVADKFGRKNSILLGSIFSCLGYSLYNFSTSFENFLVANFLLGIGYSFISGADSALAYDSFKLLKNEEHYLKYESQVTGFSGLIQVVSSVCGGLLAIMSLHYPIIAQSIFYILLIPCALLLKETPCFQYTKNFSLKEILSITSNVFLRPGKLKWFVLYFTLAGNMTHTVIWIIQPLYQDLNIDLKWFGILWGLQYLLFALSSRLSYKFTSKINIKASLICFLIVGVSSYFAIYFLKNFYALLFVYLLFLVRGSFKPLIQDLINKQTESNIRATVFSIENFIKKFFYILIGPIIGFSLDQYSIAAAFLCSGLIYLFLSIPVIYQLSKI